METSKWYNSVV